MSNDMIKATYIIAHIAIFEAIMLLYAGIKYGICILIIGIAWRELTDYANRGEAYEPVQGRRKQMEKTNNMEKLLDEAYEKARSFSGLRPPNNAYYIGSRIREINGKSHEIYYFKNDEGEFYYQSEATRQFELKMREAEKRRRQNRRLTM